MIKNIDVEITELKSMKSYPKDLFYIGDLNLLKRKKVSIVGSRKPNQYARNLTHDISSKLSKVGVVVVSGGAIGIDAIAHKGAGSSNTIMVSATGLDKRYPSINKNIIADIEKDGLVISQFKPNTPSQKYNFILRNELVVALGDILIVTYADLKSGTQSSIEYAKKMKKEIYVLPHRIGESSATNKLLEDNEAKAIYDVDSFVSMFGEVDIQKSNDFLTYCSLNPSYEEAIKRYPSKVFESELLGDIEIVNGKIRVLT